MLIKVSQEADKKRRLKAEDEKPTKENLPIGYGRPAEKLSVQQVEKHYQDNFRSGADWKPGRVTPAYRDGYENIEWD